MDREERRPYSTLSSNEGTKSPHEIILDAEKQMQTTLLNYQTTYNQDKLQSFYQTGYSKDF